MSAIDLYAQPSPNFAEKLQHCRRALLHAVS